MGRGNDQQVLGGYRVMSYSHRSKCPDMIVMAQGNTMFDGYVARADAPETLIDKNRHATFDSREPQHGGLYSDALTGVAHRYQVCNGKENGVSPCLRYL